MAKFNVYKIIKSNEDRLIEKLNLVGLVKAKKKEIDEFEMTFFFSKFPSKINPWWVELYSEYIDDKDSISNEIHFGVMLISNDSLLYAISLGKTHFYLKNFCDTDFGINLAERITDKNEVLLKNSQLIGGKKVRTIISYQDNSSIEYDSGESINYIKAKPINRKIWGEVISFGNSVQFSLKMTPNGLPKLINSIEKELAKDVLFKIPRGTIENDESTVQILDKELETKIEQVDNTSMQYQEGIVSGVDFIFQQHASYDVVFKKKKYPIKGNLNSLTLKECLKSNSIAISKNINNITIRVNKDDGKCYTSPLKNFIDYTNDDRYCLSDGKWHKFNQDYIDYLKKKVDEIKMENSSIDFSEADFVSWKKKDNITIDNNLMYREYYFNKKCSEEFGYDNFDRDMSYLKEGYKFERFDLYKDGIAYFVKIGTPSEFIYCVDQSLNTLDNIRNKTIKDLGINGKLNSICLWFILKRKTKLKKISDFLSLILLIKLSAWKNLCQNIGYEPIIQISYKVD